MHIALNVFDTPVHQSSSWIFNCYVIEGDDGFVAVDPGLECTGQGALDIVRRLGGLGHDLRVLTSTHGHSDHVGAMPGLLAEGDRTVHLPRACADYLDGNGPRVFGKDASVRFLAMYAQQKFEIAAAKGLIAGKDIGYGLDPNFTLPFEPTGFLSDGAPLPGAPDWEVVEMPGHSDCSTGFYHRESETLLTGDAVLTIDGVPWFNPEFVDIPASEATEERLRALSVKHLFPGHGKPIHGDVWARARTFRTPPPGNGLFARCARRFGRWDY